MRLNLKPNFVWLLFVLTACQTASKKQPLFELVPASESGIDFVNELREDAALNILSFEYFYNGAGVGVGDFNRDSLPDLFFSSNMGASKLYLNEGGFKFKDATGKSGIRTEGKWASGVSVVDINQDGWPDIYLSYGGPHDADKRANELYINNQDGSFTERAVEFGLADTGHTVQAAFFDYDRDGDLDCYLLTNFTDELGPNIIRPKRVNGEMINTDRLYRNDGGKFVNVSREAGILKEGYGLGLSIVDVNQDGWPDIFVSNDYISNNLLYINNKNGTFTDVAATSFKHTSYSAMGNDAADINNDGWPDLMEVDMLPPDNFRQKLMLGMTNHDRYRSELQMGYDPQFMRNSLHLHQGLNADKLPLFSEIGQLSGVSATDWSWAPLLADFDNDGKRDLFITNGYPRDITNRDFITYQSQGLARRNPKDPLSPEQFAQLQKLEGAYLNNFMYRNEGNLLFADSSSAWGFMQDAYSTGGAYVDIDNDGDLDIVVVNTGKPAFLYRNNSRESKASHFIRLLLNGRDGNLDGICTKIWMYHPDGMIFHEHQVVRGYQSSVDPRITIGLGEQKVIDSIVVQWPDGRSQILRDVPADRELTLRHADARENHHPTGSGFTSLFTRVQQPKPFVHVESPYTDFNNQPLLPHKFSYGGPGLAVGDVNGDGLDDFFIGGAYNQSGEIFIQDANGQFARQALDEGKKREEDMGALFFDADGDGDLDLYVVSGGNEFGDQSPYYQDRLYLNNGKGQFTKSADALPQARHSGSCVVAADFDRDGDLDLFVGGRIRPQHYPEGGVSQLLENRGGKFVDVTAQWAPQLAQAGMVNAAIWTDINQDQLPDLVVVGEWMPVTVWLNKGNKFENHTEVMGLANTIGWWNSVEAGDFDKDGRIDLVLGNHGLNSRYATAGNQPVGIYWHDFAGVGNRNAVITYTNNGEEYPIHPRDDLMLQLPALRKAYPYYTDYAKAKMKDLFPPEKLRKASYRRLNELRSMVLLSRGDQSWEQKALPIEAQFAPVFGLQVFDLDEDGNLDILLTGNDYSFEVINGPTDALNGLLLRGDGSGSFKAVKTDFMVPGDAKSLARLRMKDGSALWLAAQNDGPLLMYKQTKRPGSR